MLAGKAGGFWEGDPRLDLARVLAKAFQHASNLDLAAMSPAKIWAQAQPDASVSAPSQAPRMRADGPHALLARVDLHGGVLDEDKAIRLALQARPHFSLRCKHPGSAHVQASTGATCPLSF